MDHHDRGDVALAMGFRLIQHLSCLCGRHVGPSCRGQPIRACMIVARRSHVCTLENLVPGPEGQNTEFPW